jgi:hypothetical protein
MAPFRRPDRNLIFLPITNPHNNMNLFTVPQPAPIPYPQTVATAILANLNLTLQARVVNHVENYRAFWCDPLVTPDELLVAIGDDNARLFLAASRENLRHIAGLAELAGRTLNDLIPPAFYEPRRAFVEVEGQPLSITPPADGFDAWGNAIVPN